METSAKVQLNYKTKDSAIISKEFLNPECDDNLIDDERCYSFNFDGPLKEGRFNSEYHGIPLECLLKRSDVKRLYILLNGGRWLGNGKLAAYPSFSKWKYYSVLDGNVLCIDDPMYNLYPDLNTGWFFGTEDQNYREIISDFIKEIAMCLDVNFGDIIFISSLANTNASLHMSSYIKDSKIVAINPIIDLSRSGEVSGFKKITDIDLKSDDIYSRNKLFDVIFSSSSSSYIIACNVASQKDYELQVVPLFEHYGVMPVFGLNVLSKNLRVWLYNAPAANTSTHNSVDDISLIPIVDFMIRNLELGDNFLMDYISNVANRVWYDHYVQKSTICKYREKKI